MCVCSRTAANDPSRSISALPQRVRGFIRRDRAQWGASLIRTEGMASMDVDDAEAYAGYAAGKGEMAAYDDAGFEGADDDGAQLGPISADDSWHVISSYFEENGLVKQQLDSYNEFVENSVQQIVEEMGDLVIVPQQQYNPTRFAAASDPAGQAAMEAEEKTATHVKFSQIYISNPTHSEKGGETSSLFPREARLRNLTYATPLYVDVVVEKVSMEDPDNPTVISTSGNEYEKSYIGEIPVMLKSHICRLCDHSEEELTMLGECAYDQGGYFIVNGTEKVLIAQERMANNHVYVFKKTHSTKFDYTAEIRSVVEHSSRVPSSMTVKMKSPPKEDRGKKMFENKSEEIVVQLPYIRSDVPLAVLFRAMGFEADEEILQRVVYDMADVEMCGMLEKSLDVGGEIRTQEQALLYIGRRGATVGVQSRAVIEYARDVLHKELLPHIGVGEAFVTKKAYFIGYMVHRMLLVKLGRRDEDDRDHYGNKRLDLAGPLMANLFRLLFRKFLREMRSTIQKSVDKGRQYNFTSLLKHHTITNGLRYALATGNWGMQGEQGVRTGVSQVLNRLTYASTLSHLRRLNSPIGREGKLAKPRQLHNSHWGMICPAETPEGQACGLVKNLALMTYVSVGCDPEPVAQILEEWTMLNLEEVSIAGWDDTTRHDTTRGEDFSLSLSLFHLLARVVCVLAHVQSGNAKAD